MEKKDIIKIVVICTFILTWISVCVNAGVNC